MEIVQQTADLLPEEGIVSIDFSPVHLLQVPVDIRQYVHPAASRSVDNTEFLFNVRESYRKVIPQFLDIPNDIDAKAVGVFVKQDDYPVKTDKGSPNLPPSACTQFSPWHEESSAHVFDPTNGVDLPRYTYFSVSRI
jgi:hypothetical protein